MITVKQFTKDKKSIKKTEKKEGTEGNVKQYKNITIQNKGKRERVREGEKNHHKRNTFKESNSNVFCEVSIKSILSDKIRLLLKSTHVLTRINGEEKGIKYDNYKFK